MTLPAQRARELFQQALDRPAAQRDAFLDRECGTDPALRAEVASLLAALDQAEGFLIEPTREMPTAGEAAGTWIDRYKLLQQIGEGGFGVVWMAEQLEPVRRKVALKIIKLGMDTRQVVARFEAERQALALMDHPNIAKVLDGGSTETGRPYFVMELVRGVPITEFCDQASLSPAARIALFQQVCHAVQHAHQKGVVHRDLKPNNILVAEQDGTPIPKVIDFGIAKATHQELTQRTLFTEFRQLIGTPEYMAPEQAEFSGLDIDTRADVYSLGVILYELLTGTKPLDAQTLRERGHEEMLRQIREIDPPKPSTRVSTLGDAQQTVARKRRTGAHELGRLLRGDLDWIVMKALEKDRSRRYASASGLAEDLQRSLDHLPVEASPPSSLYRLTKFARRNTGLVTAAAVVSLALLAGAIATGLMLQRALAAEKTARTQARHAATILEFTRDMLASASPHESKTADYTLRQLLDDYDTNLGTSLADQPEIEASIRLTMSSAYRSLGQLDKADRHLERAERLASADPELRAELAGTRGLMLHDHGNYAQAERSVREAVELDRAAGKRKHLASMLILLADLGRHQERFDEAEAHANEALEMAQTSALGSQPLAAIALQELGHIAGARGDHAAAELLQTRAVAAFREKYGDEHASVAAALHDMASAVGAQGDFARAEELQRRSLAMSRATLGDAHPDVGRSFGRLGTLLGAQGKLAPAEEHHRRALTILRAALGEHRHVGTTLNNLAIAVANQGRHAEAEQLHREALKLRRETLPDPDPETVQTLHNLAFFLVDRQRVDEAAELMEEARTALIALRGPRHPEVAINLARNAAMLRVLGHPQRAEEMARSAKSIFEETAPRSPLHWTAIREIGRCCALAERFVEAETILRTLPAHAVTPVHAQRSARELLQFYESWQRAAPDPTRERQIEHWRTELERLQNTTEGRDR